MGDQESEQNQEKYRLIVRQVTDISVLEGLKDQFSPEQYQRMVDSLQEYNQTKDDSKEGLANSQGSIPILFEMALVAPDGSTVGRYYGVEAGYNGALPVFLDDFKVLEDQESQENGILAKFGIQMAENIESDTINSLYSIKDNSGFLLRLFTPDNIPGSWGVRYEGSQYENSPNGSIAIHPAADTRGDTDKLPNDGSLGCFSLLVDPNDPTNPNVSYAQAFLNDWQNIPLENRPSILEVTREDSKLFSQLENKEEALNLYASGEKFLTEAKFEFQDKRYYRKDGGQSIRLLQ